MDWVLLETGSTAGAVPDVLIMILQMVFVSALVGAAFLIAGWRAKGQQN
jgi:hypothetical protein